MGSQCSPTLCSSALMLILVSSIFQEAPQFLLSILLHLVEQTAKYWDETIPHIHKTRHLEAVQILSSAANPVESGDRRTINRYNTKVLAKIFLQLPPFLHNESR